MPSPLPYVLPFLVLSASFAGAQDAPVSDTSWGSYTASEECIRQSIRQVMGDNAIIRRNGDVFTGAAIHAPSASDIGYHVRIFQDVEDPLPTITSLSHHYSSYLAQDFRDTSSPVLIERNGHLAYEPGQYTSGVQIEAGDVQTEVTISNGEFVESGHGPFEYDTEGLLRHLDGLIRACRLAV